jgi:hypothetical protein
LTIKNKKGILIMGTKLSKSAYPSGHGPDDFKCFGPPAVQDGQLEGTKICDMGCFKQDGTDSNKFYHGAVVQSKKDGSWYTYFEWGRTGANNPQFQFVKCCSEADAESEYVSQLHAKNDKRGMWVTLAGKTMLQAKPGKDCYLVRPQATRSTGLPDAKTITLKEDIVRAQVSKLGNSKSVQKKKPSKKCDIDSQTLSLMRDLNMAAISYTRSSMADAALPTTNAIVEARDILTAARQCLVRIGSDIKDQINDNELKQLTYTLYGRIPKKKDRGASPSEWLLSQNNIMMWDQDLDAFESALAAEDLGDEVEDDPFSGMPLRMNWIDPKSDIGQWIYGHAPKATRNVHGGLGKMKIVNAWAVDQYQQVPKFVAAQDHIVTDKPHNASKPLFQPSERQDIGRNELLKNIRSNTALLFHGSRSCNISGILREGLRLPKHLVGVAITGAAFGPGCYWADDWKKSAGYCSLRSSYWARGSGGVKGREAFMFVADVVLGKMHLASRSFGYTSPPKGTHSVAALSGHSTVMNNEFVIFDTNQYCFRYLLEFSA